MYLKLWHKKQTQENEALLRTNLLPFYIQHTYIHTYLLNAFNFSC